MIQVKCVSSHPEDLADGRVLGVGETATKVDEKNPHNARLLDEGALIEVPAARRGNGTEKNEEE